MPKAIITSFIAGTYTISDINTNNIYISKPRGVLKIKSIIPKVGDIIEYSLLDDNNAIIEKVYNRRNDLIRPNISNVDQVCIVFSVKEPLLNLNLLDKFLVTLEFNNIKPIIIFSKMDLLNKEELDYNNQIIDYYNNIGYTTIKTSKLDSSIKELIPLLNNKITVFTGQSGVGKSSILNILDPTLNLDTNEISISLSRGKHTTTSVTLYKIFDGYVADTPGFGTISFNDIDELSLSQNFVEFFKVSNMCKYKPCLHINEPFCMVKDEVNKNHILKSRYDNYKLFIEEIKKSKNKY